MFSEGFASAGFASAFAGAWLIFAFPILMFRECRRIARQNEDRGVSGVWVIGSVLGLLALIAAPVGTPRERLAWAWVPLAAEVVMIAVIAVLFRATGLSLALEEQRRARAKRG